MRNEGSKGVGGILESGWMVSSQRSGADFFCVLPTFKSLGLSHHSLRMQHPLRALLAQTTALGLPFVLFSLPTSSRRQIPSPNIYGPA